MKKLKYTYSVIIIMVLFIQCGKIKLNPNAFYASDFPMTLGSYWEYERSIPIDSNHIEVDTIRITVTEKDASIGDENGLWKLEWQDNEGNLIKTMAVRFNSRKIIYYSVTTNGRLVYQEKQFNFPMKKGGKWQADVYKGIYHVVDDQVSSTKYGKDFGEGYMVYREAHPDSYSIYDSSLVIKDIGLVWRSMRTSPNLFFQDTYLLLDYEIKQ